MSRVVRTAEQSGARPSHPDADEVVLSVVIPVYNGADSLSRCLAALATSNYGRFEVIVVNDGSTDCSARIAAEFGARILDLGGGPFGPAYARNRGAELARGGIVCFLDADVAVHRDTIDHIVQTFSRRPEVDAVFGCYDDAPDAPQFVSQYKNLFHHFVHQQGREDGTTFWAGCGAIRHPVFTALGGFDEGHYRRPSIEDIELGYRLRAGGHAILLNKAIQVKHLKRWTIRSLVKSDLFDRGIPWTRLMLRDRHVPTDLNLGHSQQVSAMLVYATVLYVLAAPIMIRRGIYRFSARLVAPVVAAPMLVMVLNYRLYAFFARTRGPKFMVAVLPLHFLYYLYSVLAFVVGVGAHLSSRRFSRVDGGG